MKIYIITISEREDFSEYPHEPIVKLSETEARKELESLKRSAAQQLKNYVLDESESGFSLYKHGKECSNHYSATLTEVEVATGDIEEAPKPKNVTLCSYDVVFCPMVNVEMEGIVDPLNPTDEEYDAIIAKASQNLLENFDDKINNENVEDIRLYDINRKILSTPIRVIPVLSSEKNTASTLSKEDMAIRALLQKQIYEYGISVRAYNCLHANGIETFADLCRLRRKDLMKIRNFGKKSLKEIFELLDHLRLSLGMDITKYGFSPMRK